MVIGLKKKILINVKGLNGSRFDPSPLGNVDYFEFGEKIRFDDPPPPRT